MFYSRHKKSRKSSAPTAVTPSCWLSPPTFSCDPGSEAWLLVAPSLLLRLCPCSKAVLAVRRVQGTEPELLGCVRSPHSAQHSSAEGPRGKCHRWVRYQNVCPISSDPGSVRQLWVVPGVSEIRVLPLTAHTHVCVARTRQKDVDGICYRSQGIPSEMHTCILKQRGGTLIFCSLSLLIDHMHVCLVCCEREEG